MWKALQNSSFDKALSFKTKDKKKTELVFIQRLIIVTWSLFSLKR
jgi:hypothetical protein